MTGLRSRRESNCNSLVTRLGYVIPTVCQWSRDLNIDLDSSFASNQTSNIFYLKILHTLLSASDLLYINSDITSHTSALALSREKVLRVLQSQDQAAYLMAGLQEKTTFKSAPFPSGGDGARDALQRKATGGVMSKMVRRRLARRGQA